jgi:apolipoprotein N-acyltransferase
MFPSFSPSSLRFRLGLAVVSAILLDFSFPVAGPMPPLRAILSMFALLPLFYALLQPQAVTWRRYVLDSALVGYACGVLWYGLNCYWIYATMHQYGGLPPVVAVGIVLLFSLILGLYFALFAACTALIRRAFDRTLYAALAIYGLRSNTLLRTLPAFPGTSSATARSTTCG